MTTTLHIPPHPSPIHLTLFTSVTNASHLRAQLLAANPAFAYALLDARALLSLPHLLAAVFRALADARAQRLKTRSLHAEIVYALARDTNIAAALRAFGVADATTSLLCVKVGEGGDVAAERAAVQEFLAREVQGTPAPIDALDALGDWPTIRKLYKLDAAPGSGKGGPAKTVNGAGHAGLTDAERKEAEVNIMGLIALKGS